MKLDFTRIVFVLLGFFIAQIVIQYILIMIGLDGVPFIIVYNLLLSFFATLLYYPSEYRKEAFKNPDFYRNAAIFFLIFLVLSLVRL